MTLANGLTLSRLLLCGPIFYLLWMDGDRALVFSLFAVAALTDLFDGHVARLRGEESALGKVLDPVADKFLVVGTLVAFAARGVVPITWLAVLAAKELLLLAGGVILLGKSRPVIPARLLGKAATVCLLAGLVLLLLTATAGGKVLIGLGIVLSLGAGIDYAFLLVRLSRQPAT